MDPIVTTSGSSHTVDDQVGGLIHDARQSASHALEQCKSAVQASPGKAILMAMAAGYSIHRLPLSSILRTQMFLIVAILPPALLAFGAFRVAEALKAESKRRA